MKVFVYCIIFLLGIPSLLFSQYTPHQYSELRGLEDSTASTHLFYRKLIRSTTYENSVYHYNIVNSVDTLLFLDLALQPVTDYQFWNNNPDKYIFSTMAGCIGGAVKRFDSEMIYTNNPIRKLGISVFDDSVVYSDIGISTDGGRTWPEIPFYNFYAASPYDSRMLFFNDQEELTRSRDGGLTKHLVESTYSWWGKNDFIFDADSAHIYAVANSYSGTSWNQNFLVSDSKGDSGTWNSTFTSSSKIFIAQDPHAIGKLYIGSSNTVHYSSNFGSAFTRMFTFKQLVAGLYKKPDCPYLYIATTDTIYEYNGCSLHAIKGIPLAKEIMNYDPLDVGNKWIYQRSDSTPGSPVMQYLEVKEVLKDTMLSDGNKYKKVMAFHFNRYYESEKTYTYERIDTATGLTYFYNGGSFYKGDELNFNLVNEFYNGSRYGSDYRTELQNAISVWLFEHTWDNKHFVSAQNGTDNLMTYDLSYSLGLTKAIEKTGNLTVTKNLTGCKISNKTWGDVSMVVSADDKITAPERFSLSQNYPNPFNPATLIKYSVASAGNVKISLYDVLGKKLTDMLNEHKSSGSYEVSFDGSSLPSGVYFYRIETGSFIETRKMVLLR